MKSVGDVIAITGLLSYQFYGVICSHEERVTSGSIENPAVVVTVIAVAIGILLFLLLNKLNEGLVVRDQIRRGYHVREFSRAVNSTLRLDEILRLLLDVIKDDVPVGHVYLCMKQEDGSFATSEGLQCLDYAVSFCSDYPLGECISRESRGFAYDDLKRSARCLAIADSFDAMVSKRSYKNKLPVETALVEIENNLGTQFDYVLGRLFVGLVREEKIKGIVYLTA